ncbi:MAG: type ISP restriction/modification enzyme, partial [Leadbetterella sp.]|nr:type ISP restriction/modification enzyme [Leadbetterella sp.]
VNPKIAGTTHNVFGIQTGVAIMFLVRKANRDKKAQCNIQYTSLPDDWRKEAKLQWLSENLLKDIPFVHVQPDKNNNWINLTDNDFDSLIPIADKAVKLGRGKKALFEMFSLGVVTNRDEWVYDFSESTLTNKVNFLIDIYNVDLAKHTGKSGDEINDLVNYSIKWTRAVKNDLSKGKTYAYNKNLIVESLYRPFVKKKLYFSRELNEMQYLMRNIFGPTGSESPLTIYISGCPASKPFGVLATNTIAGLDFIEKTQCIPLYCYDVNGARKENVTDWGFSQFTKRYGKKGISKESIFHYAYSVLHHPTYRIKYELNLKREFPRIPFYEDFQKWAAWGKALMDLHINFETAEPFNLAEITLDQKENPKTKLKADKENSLIILDENSTLSGIPPEAWLYKLGNRSALEWVLDQYKEKKSSDPTIEEKFNTYRFADCKTKVIDLLRRICTVSIETVRITREMEAETNPIEKT